MKVIFAALLLALTSLASHATMIANGSYENGDFTGWVTQDLAVPFFPLQVNTAGQTPGFGFFVSAPTHGQFAALHGFDGGGPGTIRIAQDIFVTAASTILFDYRAAWNLIDFCSGCANRLFDVNIEVAGGGANLASFSLLTALAGTTNLDTGNLQGSVDLSAFMGQNVRLSFDFFIPDNFSGPAFFQLDNVHSVVPAPSVLMLMLFGALAWGCSRKKL